MPARGSRRRRRRRRKGGGAGGWKLGAELAVPPTLPAGPLAPWMACRRWYECPPLLPALQDAYGTASFELKAPMSADLRMPTAANENLMVAVALHQLESKGLLNIRCGQQLRMRLGKGWHLLIIAAAAHFTPMLPPLPSGTGMAFPDLAAACSCPQCLPTAATLLQRPCEPVHRPSGVWAGGPLVPPRAWHCGHRPVRAADDCAGKQRRLLPWLPTD